eukprot:5443649-Amphidinium_carterae.1
MHYAKCCTLQDQKALAQEHLAMVKRAQRALTQDTFTLRPRTRISTLAHAPFAVSDSVSTFTTAANLKLVLQPISALLPLTLAPALASPCAI